MKKLLIFALTLLAAAAVAFGGGRAGGRPKLRSFASAAEALASVRLLKQTVSPGMVGLGHTPRRRQRLREAPVSPAIYPASCIWWAHHPPQPPPW